MLRASFFNSFFLGMAREEAESFLRLSEAFSDAFAAFEKTFDYKLYDKFATQFKEVTSARFSASDLHAPL